MSPCVKAHQGTVGQCPWCEIERLKMLLNANSVPVPRNESQARAMIEIGQLWFELHREPAPA